jgi:hypothetical protein
MTAVQFFKREPRHRTLDDVKGQCKECLISREYLPTCLCLLVIPAKAGIQRLEPATQRGLNRPCYAPVNIPRRCAVALRARSLRPFVRKGLLFFPLPKEGGDQKEGGRSPLPKCRM